MADSARRGNGLRALEAETDAGPPSRLDDLLMALEARWGAHGPAHAGCSPAGVEVVPPMDVIEKGGCLYVEVELPGLTADAIHLEVADDVLTVSGEKQDKRASHEDAYLRAERCYGTFRRYVPLPADANLDLVEARFEDGVLTIAVPLMGGEAQPG